MTRPVSVEKKDHGIWLTAALSGTVYIVVFFIRGLFPAGSGSVLNVDLFSQYTPLLYRYYDVVRGTRNLFFDFSLAGGVPLYADTVNELLNPFHLILLFFRRENLWRALPLMLMLYGVAASCSLHFLLRRWFPEKAATVTGRMYMTALCVSYGISGFAAYNYQVIKWMIFPVLFPLFVHALAMLLREGKGIRYALLLACHLMLSVQLGAMTLLFTLFSAALWMWCQNKTQEFRTTDIIRKKRGETAKTLGLYTLSGLLLSGIVYVPAVYTLFQSARALRIGGYAAIISRHGLDDICDRLVQIIHPVLLAMLVSSFRIRKKEREQTGEEAGKDPVRLFLVSLNVLLLVTVLLEPSNLLWHLGSYMCFPVRYAYMLLLCCAVLVCYNMPQPEAKEKKTRRALLFDAAALLCAAGALVFTLLRQEEITQVFSSLAITNYPRVTAQIALILLLLSGAAFCSVRGRSPLSCVCVSAACALCLLLFVFLPADAVIRKENEAAYEKMETRTVHAADDWHMDEEDRSLPRNGALVNGRRTVTSYLPATADQTLRTFSAMGYLTYWMSTAQDGATEIAKTFLQAPHLVGEEDMHLFTDMRENDPLDQLRAMADALGKAVKLTDEEVLDQIDVEGENDLLLEGLRETDHLYLDARLPAEEVRIVVNGTEIPLPESSTGESICLFDLGFADARTVCIRVTDRRGQTLHPAGMRIGILHTDVWEKIVAAAERENPVVAIRDEKHATISAKLTGNQAGQALVLPVVATSGWHVLRNGEEIPLAKTGEGLLAVPLAKEQSELTFYFRPPLFTTGALLSLTGVFLLLACYVVSRKKTADDTVSTMSRTSRVDSFCLILFRLLVSAAALLIYVIPFAGQIVYGAGRLFGKTLEQETGEAARTVLSAQEEAQGIAVEVASGNRMLQSRVKVTADSSETKALSPEQVRDGDRESDASRWSSGNDREKCDHWLQAQFPKEERIGAVRIWWERDNATAYTIEISDNGKDWETVLSFTTAPAELVQLIRFPEAVQTAYIRLHVTDVRREEEDLSLYYQNVSVREWEIFGDAVERFTIQAPVIPNGSGRMLEIPEVPDGFALSFAGADYEMLVDADGRIADTTAPVETEIGYVLWIDGMRHELPGMHVTIPPTDPDTVSCDLPASFHVAESALLTSSSGKVTVDASTALVRADDTLSRQIPDETINAFRTELAEWYMEETDPETDTVCAKRILLQITEETDGRVLGKEGFRIEIGEEDILILAKSVAGIRFGCVTLRKLLEQSGEGVPPCIIRDYPRYSVRGFGIDVGRRKVSIDMLKEIIRDLSAQKMNTLQIHLNDNMIIAESGYDGTLADARNLYAAFRLESSIHNEEGKFLTAEDFFYTIEEFAQLMDYACAYGVTIVPEIDTPAHSLALTRLFPETGFDAHPELADTLDLSKHQAVDLGLSVWREYLTGEDALFASCPVLHIGMDEYYGDGADYINYLNRLSEEITALSPDARVRVWASTDWYDASPETIPQDVEMQVWDMNWADPKRLHEQGFSLINSQSADLYILPGGGYDRLDVETLEREWMPNRFATKERTRLIPSYSPAMLGACYMLWNDWSGEGKSGAEAITDADLLERFREPLAVIAGKLW